MARIPQGNFGQAIARPAPQVNTATGDPIGRAVQGFTQTAENIGNDMQAMQTRNEQQAMAEELRARDAADRAQALVTMNATKDQLTDLSDEIGQGVLDGSVPKDKAAEVYATKSTKLLSDSATGIPEKHRPIGMAELKATADRFGNGVRKAVTQRDRQDVTAGISQTLEYLQRQYRENPSLAQQQAMDTVDQLGPHSTLTPDQLVKVKQGWKEGTQYTTAFDAITKHQNDKAGLDATQAMLAALPDLDPQKRAGLEARIDIFRQRIDREAQAQAERNARAAERRLNIAEAAWTSSAKLADEGALNPVFAQSQLKLMEGTPYADSFRQLLANQAQNGAIASKRPAEVRAAIDAVNAQAARGGLTPELQAHRARLEKVADGQDSAIKNDGALRAAGRYSVIEAPAPLDMSKGMPGVIAQLQSRLPAAQAAADWSGRLEVTYPEEAHAIAGQLQLLPAKERAGMVSSIAQVIGPKAAQGLAQQIDSKDRALSLAFAFGGDMTSAGRLTSEIILKGDAARRDGSSTKGEKQPDMKVNQWSAAFAQDLAGVYPNPQAEQQVREAAILISHGLAAENGGTLSTSDIDRALRLAVGGQIIEHAGGKIPIPAGMDESDFTKKLQGVKIKAQTVTAAGQAMPAADLLAKLPSLPLMPVSRGRYAPLVGGRPVLDEQMRPIVIEVQ